MIRSHLRKMPPREVFFLNTWSAEGGRAVETHMSEIFKGARSQYDLDYHNILAQCHRNTRLGDTIRSPYKSRVETRDLISKEKIVPFDLPNKMSIEGAPAMAFVLK
jgi:hypothetical protein